MHGLKWPINSARIVSHRKVSSPPFKLVHSIGGETVEVAAAELELQLPLRGAAAGRDGIAKLQQQRGGARL